MKKLLLLAVIAAMLISAIPPLRERVAPTMGPAVGSGVSYVVDGVRTAGTWVIDRIFRWSVQKDIASIAEQVREHTATGERLPDPRNFQDFLLRNRMAGSMDPWGTPYYLLIRADSIVVGSAGPDREVETDDDLLAAAPRLE